MYQLPNKSKENNTVDSLEDIWKTNLFNLDFQGF